MSGHSKWATIKHKKGAADKARGKLWAKLIRQVEVAARAGGGDIDANPTLRTMVDKAKAASVPNDTIDRAIKRATGELEGVTYESVTYEGYAPEGVAVFVDVLTDNRNRAGADIRHIFSKQGGSHRRARRGGVAVRAQGRDRGRAQHARRGRPHAGGPRRRRRGHRRRGRGLAGHLGADRPHRGARCARRGRHPFDAADVTMLPKTTVALGTAEAAQKVLRLIDALDEHDDVQDVLRQLRHPRRDPRGRRGVGPPGPRPTTRAMRHRSCLRPPPRSTSTPPS